MKYLKTFLALSALFAVSAAETTQQFDAQTAPAMDSEIIDYVNKNNFGWKATHYPKFEGLTVQQAAQRFHSTMLPPADPTSIPQVQFHAKDLPDSFDAADKWKDCIHPVRDQAQCGSCWAFGASEAFSDRLCIASGGDVNVVLSPEDMVACDRHNFGCNGGYLDKAWQYLENEGIPTEECYPYSSGNGYTARCSHGECKNGDDWKVYKIKKGSTKRFVDEDSIKTTIMNDGPVEGGFTVYQDFYMYSSGVYEHKVGGIAGGHAIKITGWGVDENDTPYWIVANSWGTSWGMKGFFWIKRGSNECGIEDQVFAGTPDI